MRRGRPPMVRDQIVEGGGGGGGAKRRDTGSGSAAESTRGRRTWRRRPPRCTTTRRETLSSSAATQMYRLRLVAERANRGRARPTPASEGLSHVDLWPQGRSTGHLPAEPALERLAHHAPRHVPKRARPRIRSPAPTPLQQPPTPVDLPILHPVPSGRPAPNRFTWPKTDPLSVLRNYPSLECSCCRALQKTPPRRRSRLLMDGQELYRHPARPKGCLVFHLEDQ